MVRSLLLEGTRVGVVAGRAGTGKTFALDATREAWSAAGYEVLGAAVARRAALELQADAGIPSTSVTALLASLRRRPLPPRAVVVLDEASMVGTRQLAALLDHVQRADAKLVLVGDHRQLPELAAGGAFRGMVRRGLAVELRENRRQSQTWERAAVEDLRDGRVDKAIAAYDAHGRLTVAPSPDDAKQRLVADWWGAGSGEDAVMIAARRSDVIDLNARAREHMRAAGRLGHEELRLPAGRFAAGDRVVVKHNDQALGVANGERGTVVDVDLRQRTLGLTFADGRRVRLDRRFLRSRTRTGDPTLTHSYAITGHVAQGMTTDRAFVLAAEGLSSEWGYTALTRGRESNHLYVAEGTPARDEFAPRGTPRDPLAQLERDLGSSRAQSLALDAVDDELAGLPQARLAATQDLWASQTRRTLAEHRVRWMPGRRRALRHAVDAEDAAQRRLTQLEEREDQLTQLVATRPIRHEPADRESVYREPLARRATRDFGREL